MLFGQLLAIAGGFLLIKALTNLLTQADYGRLSLGLTISGLVSMFVYAPFAQGVTRFYSISKENDELGEYFNLIRGSHYKMGIFVFIFAVISFILLSIYVGLDWALLVLVASLFGIVSGINLTFTSFQNAIRRREVVALHQGGDVLIRFALSVVAVTYVYSSSQTVIIGFIIGTTLILLSQWMFAMKEDVLKLNWKLALNLDKYNSYAKQFYSYLAPFKYFSVFGAIGLFSDRWILQWLYGEKEVGIYTALYLIANTPILVIVGVVSQFIIPIVFDKMGNATSISRSGESNKLLYQSILIVVILILPMIVGSYYFGEQIVGLLTNASYINHAYLLWLLVISLTIFNIGQMLSLVGFSLNKPKIYIWPMAIKTVVFLLFAYYLAAEYQILGVVLAACISAAVYLVLVLLANKAHTKII